MIGRVLGSFFRSIGKGILGDKDVARSAALRSRSSRSNGSGRTGRKRVREGKGSSGAEGDKRTPDARDVTQLLSEFAGVSQHVQGLSKQIGDLASRLAKQEIASRLLLREVAAASAPPIRVAFIMNSPASWVEYGAIARRMQGDSRFDVYVVTTGEDMLGAGVFDDDRNIRDVLSRNHVDFIRFFASGAMNRPGYESVSRRGLLDIIQPHVLFRPTLHEWTVHPDLRLENILSYRLCYIPYGLDLIETPDVYVNHPFVLECWKLFCACDVNRKFYVANSIAGGRNAVVTGHPKLDYLASLRDTEGSWPVPPSARRKFRIIWAPHHSVTPAWLGFGTFVETHAGFLHWARSSEAVEIVLRPHPLTFSRVVETGLMSRAQLDSFLDAWNGLPNTAIDEEHDFGPIFAASNMMITDGISFLGEYQVMDRPIVFIDSGHHERFSEFGTMVMRGVSTVRNVEEAIRLAQQVAEEDIDPLREERREVIRTLLPYPGQAAERIVDAIAQSLLGAGEHNATR